MKTTKRILSLVLAIVSIVSMMVIGASATTADDLELSENAHLLSVTVVPNHIADADLPEDLAEALASDSATTYGTTEPSKNNVWDLNSDGTYDFTVNTTNDTVYSNYVFTGHYGKLRFRIVENSGRSGYAVFQVRKRNLWNTTIYNVGIDRGTEKVTEFNWNAGLQDDDKIYFLVIPGGIYTNVTSGKLWTY